MSDKDERTYTTFVHLSSLSAYLGLPFGWFLGPLILWLIKKEESAMVDRHGRAAMNFNLTLTIVFALLYLVGILAFFAAFAATGADFAEPDPTPMFPMFGLPFAGFIVIAVGGIALVVVHIVFTAQGAMRANRGEPFDYPMTIRFFK